MHILKNHPIFVCLLMAITVVSCTPVKEADTNYFRSVPRDTLLTTFVTNDFQPKIRKGDVLSIHVLGASAEETMKVNGIIAGAGAGTTPSSQGHLVDRAGNIQLYNLGNVRVEGLTLAELTTKLQKDLQPFLKPESENPGKANDPIINIRFMNHRVTVLGEVRTPQVLPLENGQMTLLEALSASGDVTEFGKKNNVLIVRQTEKGKEFKRLNLQDHSVFLSPFYYMQPDDVVYVETEKKPSKNTTQVVSYIVSGVSLALVILDRIIR